MIFRIARHCKFVVRLCELQLLKCARNLNLPLSNSLRGSEVGILRNFCTYNPKQNEEKKADGNSMPDIDAITGGDAELVHKLKVILLETEVMRQEGRNIPSNNFMKDTHWQELLRLTTRTGRRKFLDFLFRTEKKKENDLLKKEKKRIELEERPKLVDSGHLRYDLGHNNVFLRFYDATMNNMYNSKLIQAMQFGQKLVIDCGYDKNMNRRENVNCAKQLMLLFSDNRFHHDPFDLHFCNVDTRGEMEKYLHKFIPIMYEPSFPLNIHEKSYLDVFPKNQLVYLTPHCRETLTEYDHNAIYIIGGLVDKKNNAPLSLAKAKKEGLKMVKLPLDRYLQWGAGSGKSLTINQVVSILLDVKRTGDWVYSLRHVPKRKVVDICSNQIDEKYNGHKNSEDFCKKKFKNGAQMQYGYNKV